MTQFKTETKTVDSKKPQDAKQLALGLARAGYRPPPPRRIRVAGRSAADTLQTALGHLVHAHRASEHDKQVVGKAAVVLCGGDVDRASGGATIRGPERVSRLFSK